MADLWAQARQQVAEYEQRTAELQLMLSTEKTALESVEREAKKLEEERAAFAKRTQEAEAKKAAAQQGAAELQAAATAAAKQHSLLQAHLELLRGTQHEVSTQLDTDRRRFSTHLAQLSARLDSYRQALSAEAVVSLPPTEAERMAGEAVAVAAGAAGQ